MRLDVRIQEPLQLEIEDFVNAVREKRAPQVTPQSALSVLETALRTIRSGSLH
jgi:predicted dehydrogenase